MKQMTILRAIKNFSFQANGTGRSILVFTGEKFLVTTTEVWNNKNKAALVCRHNSAAGLGKGWKFSLDQINNLMEIEHAEG